MKNRLNDHLSEVNLTYLKHLLRAGKTSLLLLTASVVCLIHSLIPFVFEETASKIVKKIAKEI